MRVRRVRRLDRSIAPRVSTLVPFIHTVLIYTVNIVNTTFCFVLYCIVLRITEFYTCESYVCEVCLVKSSSFEMEIWAEREGVALISIVSFIVHYRPCCLIYEGVFESNMNQWSMFIGIIVMIDDCDCENHNVCVHSVHLRCENSLYENNND